MLVCSVESAQWIKLSSSSADLTIYAGDFNTEPRDVPYKIVRHVTPLQDAWVEANGVEGGETSETPGNSYTAKAALKECPMGRRIDYIMFNSGPNVTAETVYCTLPMNDRIPGKSISYSDHEGVTAKLRLRRNEAGHVTGRDYAREQSVKNVSGKLECVDEAKDILKLSLKNAKYTRVMCFVYSLFCLLALVLSFLVYEFEKILVLNLFLFLVRLVLIVSGTYLFLLAALFFKKEVHALKGTLASLELIKERGMEAQATVEIEPDKSNGEV